MSLVNKGVTKCLQEKKNTLYRQFIRLRTAEAEHRYKRHKNKLTDILRRSKKLYFTKY